MHPDSEKTAAEHDPLNEMFSDYFLDYASYVILERAVPHLDDGLKPVQRRILHSMRDLEDGRYNKVANVVGHTMKYHPHGDASIGDALVQLGQRGYLIDTQGNWGNPLTGDNAAAPRYIEARLSKFALDVVFSPKVTAWQRSYDGRNQEPITLPVKFPLVLAQGVEGIAVGLSCRILPHNFIELVDACVASLRKEDFTLAPDFLTGGLADVSEYNNGRRGGRVRVRARIEQVPRRNLLRITEIPFGTTTGSLMESVVAANEKGKIKIARIEDNTAGQVEILVHLNSGTDPEQAIQGLYAFTDCEVSISVNACVIQDNKPRFVAVEEIVAATADRTRHLLGRELEIQLGELEEKWHFSSLEKIFIEHRIYRDIEECLTWEAVMEAIWAGLRPHLKLFKREITDEDVRRLTEIKIKRISKFDSYKADEEIKSLEKAIEQVGKHLRNLTRFTIRWFEDLRKKHAPGRERRTELCSFERVQAAKVAMANETLSVDFKEGFAGYGLKRGEGEEIGKCSQLDDIIAFRRDGGMLVTKVAPKVFVGRDLIRLAVFDKEEPLVYSMIYREGRDGRTFIKRFEVKGVTRDREYQLAAAAPGTRVLYLAVHGSLAESDANQVVVHLKPALRLRNVSLAVDWASVAVKGRGAKGNLLTKHKVDRVVRA